MNSNASFLHQRCDKSQPRATPWESDSEAIEPCRGETGCRDRICCAPSGLALVSFARPRALPWAGLSPGLWPSVAAFWLSGLRLAGRSRFLFFVCAVLLWSFSAGAAEERALLDLWTQHMETSDDHDAVLKACRDFAKAHPDDSLLPVVRGIEAWRQLRAGHRAEALQTMTADLTAPPSPVNEGARRVALGWMTRADREQIAAGLQAYYRKQVVYPKSLEQLPAEARRPVNDRFGKPWNYKLTGFAKLPGFTDQKYSLQSAFLGDSSDFKAALKLPYAARILATPAQVLAGPGNLPAVKFNVTGGAPVIAVGQAAGDLYLAFVGAKFVVVCDYTHWKIFPRP